MSVVSVNSTPSITPSKGSFSGMAVESISAGDTVVGFDASVIPDLVIADPTTAQTTSPSAFAMRLVFNGEGNRMLLGLGTTSSPQLLLYSVSNGAYTYLKNISIKGMPNGLAFNKKRNLLVVGTNMSPYFYIFSVSGDIYTNVTSTILDGGLPVDVNAVPECVWSGDEDSLYIACSILGSSISKNKVYTFSNDVLVSQTSFDIETTQVYRAAINVDASLIVSVTAQGAFSFFKRTGNTYVLQTSPIGILPTKGCGMAFNPDGTRFICTATVAPYTSVFAISNGEYTHLGAIDGVTSSATSVVWDSSGLVVVVGLEFSPYASVFKYSNSVLTKIPIAFGPANGMNPAQTAFRPNSTEFITPGKAPYGPVVFTMFLDGKVAKAGLVLAAALSSDSSFVGFGWAKRPATTGQMIEMGIFAK